MKRYTAKGKIPVASLTKEKGQLPYTILNKLLLGLTMREYIIQALRNPVNWILGGIFAVGIPMLIGRFIYGLGSVTHSSYDYPWGQSYEE